MEDTQLIIGMYQQLVTFGKINPSEDIDVVAHTVEDWIEAFANQNTYGYIEDFVKNEVIE